MEKIKQKISRPLIGSAGVHYVCAMLNMNGLLALPTVRNTKGVDVVVLNPEGTFMASLQVKTASRKVSSWIVSNNYQHWHGDGNYYIFVRYFNEKFEVFFESSENVIQRVNKYVRHSKKRGLKDWAPRWNLDRDPFPMQKVQWRKFFNFGLTKIGKR